MLNIFKYAMYGAVCLAFSSVSVAQTVKVEPTSWWVGMHNPNLQLMVSGIGAKQTWIMQSYAGVTLDNIEFGDSANYAFLNLAINDQAKPGLLTFTSSDGQLRFTYQLQARAAHSAMRQGFSADDVIYLITPDRFANGDPSNDASPLMKERPNPAYRGGRHGGDLKGVIDHLDYLQCLGVSQLWLTPVLHNDMARYSYHGYSITDLYQVDPRMGSNEQYVELSDQARKRGIGLIMDMVPNHIGSEHPWMRDKPTTDWINYGGEFVGTSHARQTVQDIHASEYDKKRFNDGWFVPTMPDLNQRNPFLATYLTQNAIWWIEYANLSGFRVDTLPYSDKYFLQDWLKAILSEYPNFNIVGEEWTSETALAAYWQKGQKNKDGYESHLPTVMDFSLQQALVKALNEPENWNTGWIHVYQSIAKDYLYADPNNVLTFGDNHDMSRLFTQLNQNVEHTKLAMTLLLTMRGIPQIYYGTEVLLDNGASDDHGDIRIDFPGGFAGHKANAKTGQGLSDTQRDMQAHVRQLLTLRSRTPELRTGALTHFSPFDEIYAYARQGQETYLVLLNKSSDLKQVDVARFKEVLGDKRQATEMLSGKQVDLNALTLPAKSGWILKVNK